MSKKNLLNESTVRRFATLANLPAIGGAFVSEHFGAEDDLVQEELPPEEMPEEPAAEEPMPEEPEFEAEETPEEEAPAAAPELEDFAREVAQSLADAIEAASKGAISVSVEGGPEEPAAEEPMPEEPMPEEPAAEEEEEELMETDEVNDSLSITEEDEERIVNEVFKRIAKKILKQKIASK